MLNRRYAMRGWAVGLMLVLALLLPAGVWAQEEVTARVIGKAAQLPRSISLAGTVKALGLNKQGNGNDATPIVITSKPRVSFGYGVSTSNMNVVSLEKRSDGKIYLVAQRPGTVTITAVVLRGDGSRTKIKHGIRVTVKENVKLTGLASPVKSLTLSINQAGYDLNTIQVKGKPATADCLVDGVAPLTWKSSKPGIIAVDDQGVATPKASGRCVLTGRATDGSGKKVAISATVKTVAASKLTIDPTFALLGAPGKTVQLAPIFTPENASDQRVGWKSSDARVATVDESGLVTAVGNGKCTITATAVSRKLSAVCQIEVGGAGAGTTYRVYTIANADYARAQDLYSTLNDQKLIAGAFHSAKASGMQVESIKSYRDLTASQMRTVLSQMATSGADADDVSVFYYSGHGADKPYGGALCGVDERLITVEEVRIFLDKVPGSVVVMLDSCLSGQYIQSKAARAAGVAYNQAVISAFASTPQKALPDSPFGGKYKILTACAPTQLSWCSDDYGFFTYVAAKGLGSIWPNYQKGQLAADANGDAQVGLNELYDYTAANLPAFMRQCGIWDAQDVQVWPKGDRTPIIIRPNG